MPTNDTMTKQEQFLWGVQTLLLLYANLHAHDPGVRSNAASVSALGHLPTVRIALTASARIPSDLAVGDAIAQFHATYVHKTKDDSPHTQPANWLFGISA